MVLGCSAEAELVECKASTVQQLMAEHDYICVNPLYVKFAMPTEVASLSSTGLLANSKRLSNQVQIHARQSSVPLMPLLPLMCPCNQTFNMHVCMALPLLTMVLCLLPKVDVMQLLQGNIVMQVDAGSTQAHQYDVSSLRIPSALCCRR